MPEPKEISKQDFSAMNEDERKTFIGLANFVYPSYKKLKFFVELTDVEDHIANSSFHLNHETGHLDPVQFEEVAEAFGLYSKLPKEVI